MAKTGARPTKPASQPSRRLLCFVDAHGGAFAVMAAALARAGGHGDALAATTRATTDVPAEVATVLAEIGISRDGTPDVMLAAKIPAEAERVDVSAWGLALHEGEGELERLALARIARDRIERRLEARASS